VFKVKADGTGFTTVYSFTAAYANDYNTQTNADGLDPFGGLILSSNFLYGTTRHGGSFGAGTVFKVKTDGTGFTNLHNFPPLPAIPRRGIAPSAGLILLGNTLYGTTSGGGLVGVPESSGNVFALNTDGTGFTNLYDFTDLSCCPDINTDGADPRGLIVSGNILYGTTRRGGSFGWGTVFGVNTDGTGFTTLQNFSDGANPTASLVLADNTLYGTTHSFGYGTVFAVKTNGTGFTNLYNFTGGSDGDSPFAELLLSGNSLYGTASAGGSFGHGTVFAVNTDGTGFKNLHSFTSGSGSYPNFANSDGANPTTGLILADNTLYGTAPDGGSSASGTIFSIFIQPQLAIIPSGQSVILTWPTNYGGFTLQSATNLVSPVWTTNSPAPVVVNGQNTVTNPISGTQQFYRLSQ